jgi:PPOX class probable F420-dependent enzyme
MAKRTVGEQLAGLNQFKLLDLTTFKRSGDPVTTPVQFVVDGDRLVVSLRTDSGKVKRIRADPSVRIAGHRDSVTLDATARELHGADARAAYALLRRRRWLLTLRRFVLRRHPSRHVSAEIRLR